jgi:hypothetical protein
LTSSSLADYVPLAQLNLALHLDDQSPFWLIVEVLWYMELSFTHRFHAFSFLLLLPSWKVKRSLEESS